MDGMGGPFTGFDTAMLTLAQKLGLLTPTAGQDIDLDAQQAQQQAQQAQALAEHVAQRRRAQAVQQTLDRAPGPVQDIADVTQGVGRTALGLGRMVTTPPMVAAQQQATDLANDLAVDQATGQGGDMASALW